ncbi:MAG: superoxide dismutase family protein [Lachnospiraceae bacterium]|nr:superoxide dismutase family protein [Lachnospiraceae bacterium]
MQFDASALVKGNALYPDLLGVVTFHQLPDGVLINAQFSGLPTVTENGPVHFMGFHIHENGNCSQNSNHDFSNTGSHYNPDNQKHPFHRGDMPPLLNCNGFAWQSFLTNSFTIPEIIGRSVVVHALPDDFMTQPSGNSGAKIGCGIIN